MDQTENSLFDIPDYDHIEDEPFAAFPPPLSPGGDDGGQTANAMEDWDGNPGSPKEEPAKPTRKTVKRNIPKLDADRLVSERGLPALRTLFADTKFRGKGHEAEDLKLLLSRMEHWAHRLYPKLGFEDFISKLEVLGNKKPVQTCLKRIRLDMPIVHDDFTSEGAALLEGPSNDGEPPDEDAFDMHLSSADADPFSQIVDASADSPPPSQSNPFLSEETRLRIERNKQLALERRLAKIQSSSQAQDVPAIPAPLLVEDKVTKVQELEEFGEDMDAEFLDALVAAAAETEASVIDVSGNAATTEVDNSSTARASDSVPQVTASDHFVADSPSKEGSETAVVKEAPKTIPVDVDFEVEKPEVKEPLDTHVPPIVTCQDVDFATASWSTGLAEEGAETRGAFQDHTSMKNVEKSADMLSSGPEAPAPQVALGTPTDDSSAMEPSAAMLISGNPTNRPVPEDPNLSVEVTEATVKATSGSA